jgi:hypothetical protein
MNGYRFVARVNTGEALRYNHLVHNKIENQRGLQNVAGSPKKYGK